jgi:hypothetical protein
VPDCLLCRSVRTVLDTKMYRKRMLDEVLRISDEIIESSDVDNVYSLELDTPFTTANGICMGDPGTKGLLTLIGLVSELEAHEDLNSKSVTSVFNEYRDPVNKYRQRDAMGRVRGVQLPEPAISTPQRRWIHEDKQSIDYVLNEYHGPKKQLRVFSTAGDDQITIGTRVKLAAMATVHQRNSMVINDEKNMVSPIAGLFCERLILKTGKTRFLSSLSGNYESHMMVDNLKLRLFSPYSKAQESSNESNPAIGKAKVLMEQCYTLPADWSVIRDKLVTNRFQQRMYPYLPRLSNGAIDPIVQLPRSLGGLDLCVLGTQVWCDLLPTLSEGHKLLMNLIRLSDSDDRIRRTLFSYSKDRFARGVSHDENVIDTLIHGMDEYLTPYPMGLTGTVESNGLDLSDCQGYFAKRQKLSHLGFVGDKELKSSYSRSVLQTKMLTESVTSSWSNAKWTQRRNAFEKSIASLLTKRETEGRSNGIDQYSDAELLAWLECLNINDIKEQGFEEETFYSKSMIMNRYDPETGAYLSSIKPVEEIIDSFPRLELPPVNNRGWFPKN